MNSYEHTYALFCRGLAEAHAMEITGKHHLDEQSRQLGDYPELRSQILLHVNETKDQARRLEAAIATCGRFKSGPEPEDVITAFSKRLASSEGILERSFAMLAFEHYEVARYRMLIGLATSLALSEPVELLQQSLIEEENMAQWLEDHSGLISERYLAVRTCELRAH